MLTFPACLEAGVKAYKLGSAKQRHSAQTLQQEADRGKDREGFGWAVLGQQQYLGSPDGKDGAGPVALAFKG